MLLSYNYAFADAKPQLGAAVGVILSLIILACTGVYYLVLRLIMVNKWRLEDEKSS